MSIPIAFLTYIACLPLACAFTSLAQQNPKSEPIDLVMPTGPGRVIIPAELASSLQLLALYDDGHRPVAQFSDKKTGVDISYILFPNLSGKPNAQGCREDVIEPLIQRFGKSISNIQRSDTTASYFIASMEGVKIQQQNNFAFAGDATTCAEIHVSKTSYKPSDEAALSAPIAAFQPELTYTPVLKDYFILATILFKNSPASAAPYYQSALARMPATANMQRPRRILTDQLAMSLGISGKLAESRALLEAAIANDPDYPLNYYNLACADAEQGDAAKAAVHLQQAFDRKQNVLQGEALPDPTKDDSLLKLKNDKAFWKLAQSLSPPAK